MSFEKGLSKLERIVKKLESEEIDLETAVADFEEGIKIKNYCEKKLEEATFQVNRLLQDGNLRPLNLPKLPQESLLPETPLDLSDLD